jgi:hypothetical protein
MGDRERRQRVDKEKETERGDREKRQRVETGQGDKERRHM